MCVIKTSFITSMVLLEIDFSRITAIQTHLWMCWWVHKGHRMSLFKWIEISTWRRHGTTKLGREISPLSHHSLNFMNSTWNTRHQFHAIWCHCNVIFNTNLRLKRKVIVKKKNICHVLNYISYWLLKRQESYAGGEKWPIWLLSDFLVTFKCIHRTPIFFFCFLLVWYV